MSWLGGQKDTSQRRSGIVTVLDVGSSKVCCIIGRLLPRNVTEPVELKYYSYNFANRKAQISLRTDQWSRATDGAAGFQLLTTLASDTPAITSLYSAQGDLIRRVHPDGSVTEPATLENIRKIWKGKGLNTGTSSR